MSAPSGAQLVGPASADAELTVQFHLAQQVAGSGLAQLVELAANSPAGQPTRPEDVAAATGATTEVGDAVTGYFAKSGLTATIDPTRTFASVRLSVAQAAKLLSTSFSSYGEVGKACALAKGKPRATHCDFVAPAPNTTVTLPGELATNLNPGPIGSQLAGLSTRKLFVSTSRTKATDPASMYDAQNPNGPAWWNRSGTGTPCPQAAGDTGFMISQLRTAYGFPGGKPASGPFDKQNVIFVGLDGLNGASQQMMTAFVNCVGIAPGDQPSLKLVPHGGSTPNPNDGEANGDAQTLAGFGAPALDTIYEVNDGVGSTPAGFLQTLVDATTFNDPTTKTPVDVVSISYAACEAQVQETFGFSIDMSEQVLAKAALAGRTVVAATGDSGSSGCVANGIGPTDVAVNYPASSRWVTAVGGTRLLLDKQNQIQETQVWNDSYLYAGSPGNSGGQVDGGPGAGGGGVSTVIDRPSWQTGTGVDSSAKRQLPDVSYFADPHPGAITNYLGWNTFDGTSMAAPMFAAAVVQYNARHPGAHLGFVNPKLYAAINAGKVKNHDITKGTNIIGVWNAADTVYNPAPTRSCCTATVGFDTASGWGSIDVQSMIDGIEAGGS